MIKRIGYTKSNITKQDPLAVRALLPAAALVPAPRPGDAAAPGEDFNFTLFNFAQTGPRLS
jgi:hypothetical protein